MRMFAQITEDGTCVAYSSLAFKPDDEIPPNLIEVDDPEFSPIGLRYENGQWVEPEVITPNVEE